MSIIVEKVGTIGVRIHPVTEEKIYVFEGFESTGTVENKSDMLRAYFFAFIMEVWNTLDKYGELK